MAIAGQIEYQITVDTSGLKKGLDDAKKQTNKFASTVGSVAKSAGIALGGAIVAGTAVASSAILKLTKSAVESYAEFEQLQGGIETLFKDSADEIFKYADEAYKTAGISANKYMEQATAFSASLLQSLQGDTSKSAKITDMAIKDMADNANKMGTALDSIQTAYQGFAKQNYTMLDNLKLGYGGTKTEMERLLKDAEKITGVKYDINNLADVYSAIHAIQEQMDITGTTAKEAGETISGSLAMTKSAWQNLITGIADKNADFDKLMDNFVESAETFGKNVLPVIKTAIKGAVKLIRGIVPEIIKLIPELVADLLPAILEAVQELLVAIVENLPTLIQVLLDSVPILIEAIMQIIMAIVENLPQILTALTELIMGIIKILTSPENLKLLLKAGITLLLALVQAIPDVLVAIIDALPDIIDGIVEFLTDPENLMLIIEGAVKLFMGIVMAVPKILGALFEAFGKLIGNLWNRLQELFKNFASDFGKSIRGIFVGAINGILAFIEGFINSPIDVLNFFIDAINGLLSVVSGGTAKIGKIGRISLPRISDMATGGIVQARQGGQLIRAGEAGQDEWVVPESKMASLIQKINENGGTGGGVTINIQGVFATSDAEQRAVAEQIYDKLQEINKSRMGAYL